MKGIGIALVAGMMVAALLVMMAAPRAMPARVDRVRVTVAPDLPTLRRCRTLTMPDAGCEAAWGAEHRRFFQGDAR